jgi:hypothetical protein
MGIAFVVHTRTERSYCLLEKSDKTKNINTIFVMKKLVLLLVALLPTIISTTEVSAQRESQFQIDRNNLMGKTVPLGDGSVLSVSEQKTIFAFPDSLIQVSQQNQCRVVYFYENGSMPSKEATRLHWETVQWALSYAIAIQNEWMIDSISLVLLNCIGDGTINKKTAWGDLTIPSGEFSVLIRTQQGIIKIAFGKYKYLEIISPIGTQEGIFLVYEVLQSIKKDLYKGKTFLWQSGTKN